METYFAVLLQYFFVVMQFIHLDVKVGKSVKNALELAPSVELLGLAVASIC